MRVDDEGWLVRPDDAIFGHEHPVYVEITESVPITHFRWCHSVLAEMRSRGVMLAIDDLGAGYSNLKYIADINLADFGPAVVAALGTLALTVQPPADRGKAVDVHGSRGQRRQRRDRRRGARDGERLQRSQPGHAVPAGHR